MRRNDRYFVEFINELKTKKTATYSYIIDCVDYDVVVEAFVVENYALLKVIETSTHGIYRDNPLVKNYKTYVEITDNFQEELANSIKDLVSYF